MLHEVQMLEGVRHPNIIAYKHSWIESTKLAEFGKTIWIVNNDFQ